MRDDPYKTPDTLNELKAPDTQQEATRKKYIKHEASVKSIGSLYILASLVLILISWSVLMNPYIHQRSDNMSFWMAIAIVILAVFQLITGFAVHRLKTWSRPAIGILSTIGLLAFPLGTIINAYILYLVFSSKGSTVFSKEYRNIIDNTPHIKYKTSIIVLVLFILLLVAIVGALVLPRFLYWT